MRATSIRSVLAVPTVLAALLVGSWSDTVRARDDGTTNGGKQELGASEKRGAAYAHLMRSLFSIREGEYGTAIEEIHGAIELEPESPDLLIEAAGLLSLMHRNGEAERLARRALTLDPEHDDAVRFLADSAAERAFRTRSDSKSRAEAIRLYEALAARSEEPDPDVLRRLAQLQIQSDNIEQAIEATRRLVKALPGDRQATTMLTELLLQDDRREEALRVLLGYLAEHPFDEDLINWGKELVTRLNGWPLVSQVFAAYAPFAPDQVGINLFHAEALQREGRLAESTELLEGVLTERPGDDLLRRQLILSYRRAGRMADAAVGLADLIDDYPDEPVYQVWLADTLENQGEESQALEAWERALASFDTSPERAGDRDSFRQRLVILNIELGDIDSARDAVESMEDPEGAVALESRVRLAIETEDWSTARQNSRRLKSVGPPGFGPLLEGEVAVSEKRWSEAQKRFAEAVREIGSSALGRIAEIYRRADRPDKGEELLQKWVRDEPENADARYSLGAYLYQIEHVEASEGAMREAFRLDPDHAPALNFLGYSLAERNVQLEEALTLIERALELDAWNGAFLDSLGWVYYQLGRYDEARGPLERAARELPNDPTVLEHLGDLYLELGEPALALNTWDRALKAEPEDAGGLRLKIERERTAIARDEREEESAESRLEPPSMPVPR